MTVDPLREKYGPLALVTGASSGIGAEFSRLLAARGFNLLLTARSEQRLQALSESLRESHSIEVEVLACDLSVSEDVDRLISRALQRSPTMIVSNAGFGVQKGALLSVAEEELAAMYAANSTSPARLLRALLPSLVERGRGGVICTGSIEGDTPFPYSTAYAASKAFLHSFVLGLWYEMRGTGVDVLLLAPGSTDTEAPIKQGISRDQLLGVMSPRDVAAQALAKLGKTPHLIPGAHNRFFITLLRWLPRKWSVAMAGKGMLGAIEKSAESVED